MAIKIKVHRISGYCESDARHSFQEFKKLIEDGWKVVRADRSGERLPGIIYILQKDE